MNIKPRVAYCINLDTRKDRWEQVTKDFVRLSNVMDIDIERVSAIKGERFPQQGLTATFKKIIGMAIDKKLPYVLITEDDLFVIDGEKVKKCLENVPEDWDILLGGAYMYAPNIKKMCDNMVDGICQVGEKCRNGHSQKECGKYEDWVRIKDFCGNHFIIINARIYHHLLPLGGTALHFDRVIGKHIASGRFKAYLMYPMPCQQRPGFSDLRKRNVNDNKKRLPWVDHPDTIL